MQIESGHSDGVVFFLVLIVYRTRTHLNAARMSAAGDGLTEPNLYFCPHRGKNANRVRPQFSSIFPIAKSMFFCYNVKYMIVNRDERKEQPLCALRKK